MEDYIKDVKNGDPSKEKATAVNGTRINDASHDEPPKTGGMFRFGKAIASALNPIGYWQGMWKEKEAPTKDTTEHPQRKEQIEKAYAELKSQGGQGMMTTIVPPSAELSRSKNVLAPEEWKHDSFRDSGISMGESSHRKSADTIALQNKIESRIRSITPSEDAGLGRRSFSYLRSPSMTDLKKVKSHLHLPTAKKRASFNRSIPSIDAVLADSARKSVEDTSDAGLRRQPSKKDIARVNRLNKRVSDLETKLATAKQELEASLADAPPLPGLPPNHDQDNGRTARKPFIPGALASLPSERLLGKYTENTMHDSIVNTVPADTQALMSSIEGPKPVTNESWITATPPKLPISQTNSLLDISPSSIQKTAGRTPPHPRRSKKDENRSRSILDSVMPTSLHSANTKVKAKRFVSPTPRNSPNHQREKAVPAVPPIKPELKALDKQKQILKDDSAPNTPTLPPPSPMRTRSGRRKSGNLDTNANPDITTTTAPNTNNKESSSRPTRRGTSPPPPSLVSPRKKPTSEPFHLRLRRKPVPGSSGTGSPTSELGKGKGKETGVKDGRVTKRSPRSAARGALEERGGNGSVKGRKGGKVEDQGEGSGGKPAHPGSGKGGEERGKRLGRPGGGKRGADLEKPLPAIQRESWDWGEDVF